MDLCGFKASLDYRVSSIRGRATQRNPVSKKRKKRKEDKDKLRSFYSLRNENFPYLGFTLNVIKINRGNFSTASCQWHNPIV